MLHASARLLRLLTVAAVTASLVAQEAAPATADVALDLTALASQHAALAARLDAARPLALPVGGLCGARGAATVKLTGRGAATLQLPLPQHTAGQIPLVLGVAATPAAALRSLVLRATDGGTALVATVQDKLGTEVTIAWNSVVLLVERPDVATADAAAPFRAATPCAQANDAAIAALAAQLAPAAAVPAELAKALQRWLPQQARTKRAMTMDALALLASGNHGICTMNANLGVALLRQRGVPARSLAVLPTDGQRLEMHRIVEWFADGAWHRFDPSLVHADVPMRASQSVVMAITSIADEERADVLRPAVPRGCPFGQEIEILKGPAMLFGAEFFWTQALPLAAFAAADAEVTAATTAWQQFVREGRSVAASVKAASAGDAEAFAAAWTR